MKHLVFLNRTDPALRAPTTTHLANLENKQHNLGLDSLLKRYRRKVTQPSLTNGTNSRAKVGKATIHPEAFCGRDNTIKSLNH